MRFQAPRHLRAALAAASMALVVGGGARAAAETGISSNWSGYVVQRAGVRFREVQAMWVQPNVVCVPGRTTYSSIWVGLGGYSERSNVLEQAGTEVDCNLLGQAVTSAWYELAPAPMVDAGLSVWPGDVVVAAVKVAGGRTTMTLLDFTRHEGISKTFDTPTTNVSSADWIVEAPSRCASPSACSVLPLAAFRNVRFANATTVSTSGRRASISSHAWYATRLVLGNGSAHLAGRTAVGALATPSALSARGTVFSVRYTGPIAGHATATTATASTASASAGGSLFSPALWSHASASRALPRFVQSGQSAARRVRESSTPVAASLAPVAPLAI